MQRRESQPSALRDASTRRATICWSSCRPHGMHTHLSTIKELQLSALRDASTRRATILWSSCRLPCNKEHNNSISSEALPLNLRDASTRRAPSFRSACPLPYASPTLIHECLPSVLRDASTRRARINRSPPSLFFCREACNAGSPSLQPCATRRRVAQQFVGAPAGRMGCTRICRIWRGKVTHHRHHKPFVCSKCARLLASEQRKRWGCHGFFEDVVRPFFAFCMDSS